jgi:F0F1-type ATP synthase epsilon subunit
MSTAFPWSVITPEGTVASGECVFLVVPTAGGELGVLADHAALVARVVPGVLRVTASPKADSAAPDGAGSAGSARTVNVGEGIVDVRDNSVRILVTRAGTAPA